MPAHPQELAAKLPGGHAEQLQLLRQASTSHVWLSVPPPNVLCASFPCHHRPLTFCELYACAAAVRPSSHSALYNWGVALSDMARLLKESDPEQALSCLQQVRRGRASGRPRAPWARRVMCARGRWLGTGRASVRSRMHQDWGRC